MSLLGNLKLSYLHSLNAISGVLNCVCVYMCVCVLVPLNTVLPSVYSIWRDGICCRGRGGRILEVYDIIGHVPPSGDFASS